MTQPAKHTPGPWHLEYDVDGIPLTIIGADNSAIGIVETWNAHTEGNRHLLTAAPAMYEALKAMLEHEGERVYSGIGTEHDSEVLEAAKQAARTALAQAEGVDHA